ncbi:hypothetical protein [uncultured Roseibium sp.]|uniref:hypothetical protein n=1 Tax=uncultured Roseibium sp. TaxID=1936171 RepID=UPI00260D2D32|nr:hypothetical protein [uncultured Roseibium sp.]
MENTVAEKVLSKRFEWLYAALFEVKRLERKFTRNGFLRRVTSDGAGLKKQSVAAVGSLRFALRRLTRNRRADRKKIITT